MCKTSVETDTYLMAFSTLTQLNALKRTAGNIYLPMRHTPACIATPGCGFAVMLDGNTITSVTAAARKSGIPYRLYRVDRGKTPIEYRYIEEDSL